jgi:hypothetical protein
MDEREQSLAREQALDSEQRRTRDAALKSREEAFEREHGAWLETCHERETELERRETIVAAESDRLDKRRERLESLRVELEETHRSTLETRMAIEEVWAQLAETAGNDAARQRLAETQRRLHDDLQQAREAIERERKELSLLQASVQSQRHELAKEMQESAVAAKERREEFDRRHRAHSENADALRTREEQVNALHERWLGEKIEVERIIRGLLIQLGQQAVPEQPGQAAGTETSRAA